MKGLAWALAYGVLITLFLNESDLAWAPAVMSNLSEIGDFLTGVAALMALFVARQWWLERRSRARAEYLLDAYRAFTDYAVFLHEPKLEEYLGVEKLHVSVNRAFNEVQMFAAPEISKLVAEISQLDGSPDSAGLRKIKVDQLRQLIRDSFREEIGLEKINDPIRWDYWNFMGRKK